LPIWGFRRVAIQWSELRTSRTDGLLRALLCCRSDRLPILQVTNLTGLKSLEGRLRPPPNAWPEKTRRLFLGAELIGHEFLVEQPHTGAIRRCERPAVEQEHQCVVPWSVGRDPIHTQQPADRQLQAELFATLPAGGLERGFVGLGHPSGEIP